MKKILFALIVLAGLASCSGGDNDPRLVIITFDGLRWQEVFTGVDSFLVGNPDYVRNPEELKAKYWRDTPEERRQVLMPFIWSYGAENGFLVGNRNKGSQMQVANTKNYSYPGYSEMFCGWADDERVNSNNPVPNPNKSVLYEAVGPADEIYVVVEINGYLYLTRGAVLSYREFKGGLSAPRLTDEEWQQQLKTQPRKGVPTWMKGITVPLDPKSMPIEDNDDVFYSSGC